MDRRSFVARLPVLSTGLLVGASTLTLEGCGGVPYVVPRGTEDRVVVRASSVGPSGVLVQRPGMERPVFLRLGADGTPVALLVRCTHQGCQPEPVGDRLVCPCHGSEFSLEGEVLEGPAERPLLRYEVSGEGDDLVIWLQRGGVR